MDPLNTRARANGLRDDLELPAGLGWGALDASDVPMTLADARATDLPLVYVNAAFERMTGYAARGRARAQLPLPPGPGDRPRRRRRACAARIEAGEAGRRAAPQLPPRRLALLEPASASRPSATPAAPSRTSSACRSDVTSQRRGRALAARLRGALPLRGRRRRGARRGAGGAAARRDARRRGAEPRRRLRAGGRGGDAPARAPTPPTSAASSAPRASRSWARGASSPRRGRSAPCSRPAPTASSSGCARPSPPYRIDRFAQRRPEPARHRRLPLGGLRADRRRRPLLGRRRRALQARGGVLDRRRAAAHALRVAARDGRRRASTPARSSCAWRRPTRSPGSSTTARSTSGCARRSTARCATADRSRSC